nr:hypothetical protein [bacterium]
MSGQRANLAPEAERILPRRLMEILRSAGEFAAARGWRAYAVGGMVRDLLLGIPSVDLDILVEEHGLEFARQWSASRKGKVKLYRRFATAMVVTRGCKVDITTTRGERYPVPGALPEILPGSLEDDLRRRDFTINALAFSIAPGDFGDLVDVCGGLVDLKEKTIRVLHEGSFRDDPTRVFRAVRFQQRLGFSLDPGTEILIRTAVDEGMFDRVSPERLRREIELILEEDSPHRAVEAMAGYDELRFIHPRLRFTPTLLDALRRLEREEAWHRNLFPGREMSRWRIFFGGLVWELALVDLEAAVRRFNLADGFRLGLLRGRGLSAELSSGEDWSPSRLSVRLDRLPPEVILILASRHPAREEMIRRYLAEWRELRPALDGAALRALGQADEAGSGEV